MRFDDDVHTNELKFNGDLLFIDRLLVSSSLRIKWMEGALEDEERVVLEEAPFDEREMDKIIRQIVDKVRGNYLQNGQATRGIPGEVKRIIDNSIDRI